MQLGLRPSSFNFAYNAVNLLKRDLLYFEQVHICSFNNFTIFDELDTSDPHYLEKLRKELQPAYDANLLHHFNLSEMINFVVKEFKGGIVPELLPLVKKVSKINKPMDVKDFPKNPSKKMMEEIINQYMESVDASENDATRISSIFLNSFSRDQTAALLDYGLGESEKNASKVLEVVLSKLPVPDENVSWQQIVDYRSDPDSAARFTALRVWMQDISRQDYTKNEISERIDHLLHEYEMHLKFHKLKYAHSGMRIFVTAAADIIENVVKLNFGKIAETMFSLNEKKIELYEAELQAPGREIAYLSAPKKL
jgi:hypothetical protein